jgi:branched-chain amino acid transport system substrate-binding protein
MYTFARTLCIIALAFCIGGAPTVAAAAAHPNLEPYELNAIIPETGSGAFLGKSYLEAFHAMELLVNSTGGIQGHPLKIVTADTQTSGQIDVQLVNGLIAKHVQAFIDGAPSTVCLPSIPLVEKNGPLDWCLSPAVHPTPGGYVFTVNGSTLDLMSVYFRYFRARGWKRIGLLTSTDANGQDYDRALAVVSNLPENRDVQIAVEEHFNNSEISYAAQLARIKNAAPQVVLVLTTGTALGNVFRGMRDGGIALPVLTIAPNMTYAQMAQYAAFLPPDLYFGSFRAMTPQDTLPGPLRDAQAVYVKAFKAIGVKPDAGHANVWDAMTIIIQALRKYGPGATSTQVRDYVLHLHGWLGANGVYDFSNGSPSGLGQNSIIISRWMPDKQTWHQVSRPGGLLK